MRAGSLPRKSGVVQTWPGTAASELLAWKHCSGRAGLDWLVKWGRKGKCIESPLRLSSGAVPPALEVTWCIGGLDGEGPGTRRTRRSFRLCGEGSQDSNAVSLRTKPKERTKRKRTKERNKRSLCVSCGLPETPKKALLNLCSLLLPGLGAAKDNAGRSKDAHRSYHNLCSPGWSSEAVSSLTVLCGQLCRISSSACSVWLWGCPVVLTILFRLFSSPEWITQFFTCPGMMLWRFARGQGSDYQLRLSGNTAAEGALRIGKCHWCVSDSKYQFSTLGWEKPWGFFIALHISSLYRMCFCGKYNPGLLWTHSFR